MGFWAKSLRIFKCLCANGRQGVRRIAQQTGLSKSSVHRLKQAMERRDGHPESWLWETEAGRCWLTRLVVATLYTFGLKRGVGVETISEFFARLHLATQVGCSPCALRQVMQVLAATAVETAESLRRGYVRDTHEKVSQAVSSLKTIGCKLGLLYQSLLKSGSEPIRCPKKVLLSYTQNPLILQA